MSLQFVEPIATDKELKIRLDVEIANAFETFKWTTTGSEKFSSATSVPFHQIDEATEKSTYLLGFQQLFARVEYVDLNPEVINGLCNANLTIKVVSINPVDPNAVPAKPAKGAKGAPPPVEIPAEEVLVSMQIPLHSLIVAEGCSINYSESFGNYGNIEVDQKVDGSCSSLSWRLLADNDLAGYVLGAKVFRWEGAEVKHLPGTWGLQSPDVDDPKAKVKPTPEDLRAKYIKNIENLVVNQEKSAAFTLSVGKESTNALETEEGAESQDINVENQAIMDMLISLTLTNGKISYDFEIAAEVAIEEDIRARRDLWSSKFPPLSYFSMIKNNFYSSYLGSIACDLLTSFASA